MNISLNISQTLKLIELGKSLNIVDKNPENYNNQNIDYKQFQQAQNVFVEELFRMVCERLNDKVIE